MSDYAGIARIYSFPFRIYAASSLDNVEIQSPDRSHRFRVYSPFLIKEKGPPSSLVPAVGEWPDFRRARGVNWSLDKDAAPTLTVNPLSGSQSYDSLQIKAWGAKADEEAIAIVDRLLEWLRHATHQSWIGAVEVHTESNTKFVYHTDVTGAAVEPPMPYAKGGGLPPATQPVTEEIWKEAIRSAVRGDDPPTHWSTFLDSNLYRAFGRNESAVLALALSMEVARDTLFTRFAPTVSKRGLGEVLAGPFQEDTDLLKHLSSYLEEVHPDGRNLDDEAPELSSDVWELYVARHHVAHGGSAVYPVEGQGMTPVDSNTVKRWTISVHKTLEWMETL